MSIIEAIGSWGYHYRHNQKTRQGLYIHPDDVGEVTAMVGPALWLRMRGEMRSARHGNTFLFMGTVVKEGPAVPLEEVAFFVKNREIGRLSQNELSERTPGAAS